MACSRKTITDHHSYFRLHSFIPNYESFGHLWPQIANAEGTGITYYPKFSLFLMFHLERFEWKKFRRYFVAKFYHHYRIHHFPHDLQPYYGAYSVALLTLDSWIWCDRTGYNVKLVHGSFSVFLIPSSGIVVGRATIYLPDSGHFDVNRLLHKLEVASRDER